MSEYNSVMSIDPGARHIGMAFRIYGRYDTCKGATQDDLFSFFKPELSLDLVIIERFEAQLISSYGITTVELVGGIRALCWYRNIPIVEQMPQYRIAFIQSAKDLRRALNKEQHRVGLDLHECDALAHLLSWEYHVESKST